MTVRHIVMWNVRGERGSAEHLANLRVLKKTSESLLVQIPRLLKIEVGLDFSHVNYACDAVLLSEFDSPESLQTCGQHSAHLAAKLQIGDIRTARYQVDYGIE